MAENDPAPWDADDPAWAALRGAGVDAEDVEVRRYGVRRLVGAANRLDDAVWAVAIHWAGQLAAATVDEHRAAFLKAREESVYPELKDAYEAFFGETRRAMGVLDKDPRFTAALDGAAAEVK